MAIAAPPTTIQSVADVLERLSYIPPDRIRVRPSPGTAREKDAIEINESKTGLVELIDGILVEKAVSFYESMIEMLIGARILEYLEGNNIGIIAGGKGMVRLEPGQIRMPDISFVAWQSLPDGEIPDEAVLPQVPDLAVEVLSPGNTRGEIERKLRDYFASGARAVWVLEPRLKLMKVYSSAQEFQEVGPTGIVDGGDVLPGFQLSMAKLFEDASRKRRK